MTAIWRDIRFGLRILTKSPGFTLVAIGTLALGIGATTAIFSVVNTVMLRPLPYRDASRLVVPATVFTRHGTDRASVSYPDFLDWKHQTDLFDSVAVFRVRSRVITGGEQPERIRCGSVSDDYFRVMAAPPLVGRTFTPQENAPGADHVLVLSYGLWMRRFGGDAKVLGSKIDLDGVPQTIIGVMPKNSQWPEEAEAWGPMGFGSNPPQGIMRRDDHEFQSVARLRSGVSIEQAQAKLTVMARQIEREFAASRAGTGWKVHPLDRWVVGPQMRQILLVLLGAVAFVLLIACVNVANLLLARGAGRQREVAIRTALGAGRGRLIGQLLTESIALAIAGGAAGALLAAWGVQTLVQFAPAETPRLDELRVDGTFLGFALAASLATSLIFGLLPALQATASSPLQAFRDGGRSISGSRRGRRLRSLLVVTELALSIMLLIGAGLLVRSFFELAKVQLGFPAQNLLTMQVALPHSRYPEAAQVAAGFEQIEAGVRRIPGVQSASMISSLPLEGGGFYLGRAFLAEGQAEPPATADFNAQWVVTQPESLRTMGIPLLQGRYFDARDIQGAGPVMIISQSMARQMFPNQNPLGQRVRSWRDENVYREVVGVVGDIRYFGLSDPPVNLVYVPHPQNNTWDTMTLTVRAAGDPMKLLPSIRSAIWAHDKNLAIAEVQTMDQVLAKALEPPRFTMGMLAIFAAAALLLAAVGMYGVMSYAVSQRTQEIGIRMALGARATDVLRTVLGEGMAITAIGALIGMVGAIALTRVMAGMLFGVTATDPATFIAVSLFLGVVALVACFVPARRATKVDPIEALRYE
jgi:predicted permease